MGTEAIGAGAGRGASRPRAHGGRSAGQPGSSAVELLPVEERRRREETRWSESLRSTAEERQLIDEVKEQYPWYRHRRIQGVLQQRGVYLSVSVIYGHLKQQGQVEPYERRAAPWKDPRYEVWQRNQMWGSDWTKLRVGGVRWYLVTVIDFFSRWIIAWEVVPTVHAGNDQSDLPGGTKKPRDIDSQ